MTNSQSPERHAAVPPWRDVRVLRIAAQVAAVLAVALLISFLLRNLFTAMDQRGLRFGFGFLGTTAGFGISESPIPYRATDTYGRAFLVGLLNTLLVSVIGIVLATVLGVVVGVARLSTNWLVNRIASWYVELIRNTPLLVQLFLLYFAVLLQLPRIEESATILDAVYLNQRGLFLPWPEFTAAGGPWLALVAIGIAGAITALIVASRREAAGRPSGRIGAIGLLGAVAIVVVGWFAVGGAPVEVDIPTRAGFNLIGGLRLSPEFTALLLGLVIYTAGFIGEVVRGGILAVRRGQVEAAYSIGLTPAQTLRLIVFPQALRVIVPPLTSQYLNLTKNSSLAIAIGFPDLFKVGTTISNQTGDPISVIVLVMGTYLALSLITSGLMNIYNRRVQVLER